MDKSLSLIGTRFLSLQYLAQRLTTQRSRQRGNAFLGGIFFRRGFNVMGGTSWAAPKTRRKEVHRMKHPSLKRDYLLLWVPIAVAWLLGPFISWASPQSDLRAGWQMTTKGIRLSVGAATPQPEQNLLAAPINRAISCPHMTEVSQSVRVSWDSKGRIVQERSTARWQSKLGGCHIEWRRNGSAKTVRPTMVCPNGSLSPAQCHDMRS